MYHHVRRRYVANMNKALHFLYILEPNVFSADFQLLGYVVHTFAFAIVYIQKLRMSPNQRYTKQKLTRSLFWHHYDLNE